jgi:D-xylose transport system substrate-binding protein
VFDQYCQGWSADAALSNAQNCLTQNHNNIQAFICGNDQIAGAAIEALKAQGLAGKVIVTGGDCELAAVQRIMEGTQSMTVLKNAYTISGAAVTMIDQIMQGQTPTTNSVWSNGDKNNIPTMFVPMTTITKDNVQQELVDTNYYTKDQIGAQYFQ